MTSAAAEWLCHAAVPPPHTVTSKLLAEMLLHLQEGSFCSRDFSGLSYTSDKDHFATFQVHIDHFPVAGHVTCSPSSHSPR